jgi:hypothetical protein
MNGAERGMARVTAGAGRNGPHSVDSRTPGTLFSCSKGGSE